MNFKAFLQHIGIYFSFSENSVYSLQLFIRGPCQAALALEMRGHNNFYVNYNCYLIPIGISSYLLWNLQRNTEKKTRKRNVRGNVNKILSKQLPKIATRNGWRQLIL